MKERPDLPKRQGEDEENYAWRCGFADGMKQAIRQNSTALEIGNAILNVLDGHYEFIKEDY